MSVVGREGTGEQAGFGVAHGRLAEEAAVLAIELAGAFVANFEGGACGVEAGVEHAFARDVETQLLLILQRAHGGERAELMMQRGDAHARDLSELFDAQWLGIVFAQPGYGFCGAVALFAQGGNGAQVFADGSTQQAIEDFALKQTAEEWNVLWSVEKIDETCAGGEEFDRGDAKSHAARAGRCFCREELILAEDFAHHRHFELESHAKDGRLRAGLRYLTQNWHVD